MFATLALRDQSSAFVSAIFSRLCRCFLPKKHRQANVKSEL